VLTNSKIKTMEELPTAEEFAKEYLKECYNDQCNPSDFYNIAQLCIRFAKLHVKAALKAASENACTIDIEWGLGVYTEVDKETILSAYPPEKIK
jgi:hypothetical protein